MDDNSPALPRRNVLIGGGGMIALTLLPHSLLAATARSSRQRDMMRMISREARDLGVSSSLALAIARAESNFNPYAISHKGARGLMQIMPRTARTEYGINAELLWNPRINTRLGLHFLRRLLVRYKGRVDLALSHYNGGSAVGVWPNAKVIPATRKYVRKVQRYRAEYSRNPEHEDANVGYRIAREQVPRGRQEF